MPFRSRDVAYKIDDLEVDKAVGARVREIRKLRGISQSSLASALGVTFQQVQKYEKGSNRLSASMMVKTAAVLGVSVSELVGEIRQEAAGAIELIAVLAIPGARELLSLYCELPTEQRNAVRNLTFSMGSGAKSAGRSNIGHQASA
jgi:transcriptional regulator with XRE-family HTH domain